MGGYFFLLLQTLMTRPMTVTMSIQNSNKSEYVTISRSPPFLCVGGHKKTFYPPQMQWEAARLPFIGSTIVSIPYFVAKSNPASNRKRGYILQILLFALQWFCPDWAGETIRYTVGGSADTSEKEVKLMRITLHIGAFTVTIIVKRRGNRHSAK